MTETVIDTSFSRFIHDRIFDRIIISFLQQPKNPKKVTQIDKNDHLLQRYQTKLIKMKFTCLLLLGLSVLVHSEDRSSLRSGLDASLQNQNDRETGPLCDTIVRNLKNTLESKLPFTFDCNCRFRLLRPVEYSCSSRVCIDDIKDILNVNMSLPLTDATCMNPSASGTLEKRSRDMTTKVCSGSSTIELNVTQIEEETGQEFPNQDETVAVNIPSSCLQVSHNAATLTNFTACAASIGSQSCGCEVCEDGAGVMLDCTALIDGVLPEFLKGNEQVLNRTKVCLYPGIYDDNVPSGRQSADPLALGLFGLILSKDV